MKGRCPPEGRRGMAGGSLAGPLLCCQGKQGGRIAQEHRLGCVNIPPPPSPPPYSPLFSPLAPLPPPPHTHTFSTGKKIATLAHRVRAAAPSYWRPFHPCFRLLLRVRHCDRQSAANKQPERVRVAGSRCESGAFTHFKHTHMDFFPLLDSGPSTVLSSHATAFQNCTLTQNPEPSKSCGWSQWWLVSRTIIGLPT